uniref:Dynein heavy chain hydrolytic ATP-binding dynein motor region domain-containing protein n=1 Tax=Zosterops lateralis melanops TaxID=1220523 RepID=A0A8D2PF57_ZOSLA
MTVLYKLAREQLSKQHHYDFGLRALKSVLVMAGELKRGSADLSEEVVLMRALRDMNLPKFVFEDVPLFLGLISDLFPGLDCFVLNMRLQMLCFQMYETMLTRHTTMVVGPTGGGKTVVIKTLCRAQNNRDRINSCPELGLLTKLYTLNPKAMSVIELYGILDPVTRDWTDGVLKIRDQLQSYCALLFEVGDLQYASPATVSRCGMVFVDPKNLRYEPYWQKWVKERENEVGISPLVLRVSVFKSEL